MNKWLLIVLCMVAVWLVFAKPDLDSEYEKTRQLLSSEASLRSQALTSLMEKHRLASVMLARSGIINEIIQNPDPGEPLADKIRYLQALSGVRNVSVLRRDESTSFPPMDPPASLVQSGQWNRAVATAFQGSLGRVFYLDETETPTYVFFAPHFVSGQAPGAIVITTIDLSIIADGWQVSANRVTLHTSEGELIIQNNVDVPDNAIHVSRAHNQLEATLQVSAAPPEFIGNWWLRSLLVGAFLALAGLLTLRQSEKRRFLTELADQQATEAQRLESEVALRTQELESAQQQLMHTEKLALLGQMSASISHEINQPLAALKNYASTAERFLMKDRISEVGENLQKIYGLTDRISRVVVNLRGFSNNEPSPLQPVDVSATIHNAIGELTDRFPEASKACRFDGYGSSTEVYAVAGQIRLLQVLGNLLTNAWYACRDEATPLIDISLVKETEQLLIRIADNGHGFTSDMADTAFEAFVSSRENQSHNGAGMGLGLSISRSFIESMNGSLELESGVSNGAALLIRLQTLEN